MRSTDSRRTQPKRIKNKFENPWNKWPFGFVDGPYRFCKWILTLTRMSSYRPNIDSDLPIMEPYFVKDKMQISNADSKNRIRATWLGHASVLVEIDGFRILCDPVFGDRCPPIFGIHRYRPPPCLIKDLPPLDAVVISHNHYDHMDSDTIRILNELQPKIMWLIPMNDSQNILSMMDAPTKNVKEMTWWDKFELDGSNHGEPDSKMDIFFTPTQHWSNRGLFDSFQSLWGSWTLIGPTHRFWFGGDTGYFDGFKEIGENFGPFDGAAIPIGAYDPRELTAYQHVDPIEALQIHKDIQSKVSFGIHWGTFQLTAEPYLEPKQKLDAVVNGTTQFFTINIGETIEIVEGTYRKLPCEKIVFTDIVQPGWTSYSVGLLRWLLKMPTNLLCSRKKCINSSLKDGSNSVKDKGKHT